MLDISRADCVQNPHGHKVHGTFTSAVNLVPNIVTLGADAHDEFVMFCTLTHACNFNEQIILMLSRNIPLIVPKKNPSARMKTRPTMLLLIVSTITINVISQSQCLWGQFEYNEDVCMFRCRHPNTDYVNSSSLSFEQIINNCENVSSANRVHGCTMEDLVWPQDICQCPHCKCSSLSAMSSTQLMTYDPPGLSSRCINCTCHTSSDSGITDLVYSCDELLYVEYTPEKQPWETPWQWNHYKCPPESCMQSNGVQKNVYDAWFEDVADGSHCDTFCFCSASEGNICATGWSDIVSTPILADKLADQCPTDYINAV